MVDHEDPCRWIAPKQETIDEKIGLGEYGGRDESNGDDFEGFGIGRSVAQCSGGFDDQLDRHGGHEGAEQDDPYGLDAFPPNRVLVKLGRRGHA